MKQRIKNLLFSITAISLGVIVLLILAEIVLRIADITPFHRNALNAFHAADAHLGWKGVKNFKGIFYKDDFKALIQLDENGYRKKTAKIVPNGGAKKIAVLGDSFAWGWGVSQGQLCTDILQDRLGPDYDVLNFGINTYGTVQQKIQLEREVLPIEPQYVCLMVYYNDFKDNLNSRNHNRPYCRVKQGRVILKNYPITNPIGSLYRSFTRLSYALTHLRYYHNIFKEYLKMFTRTFETSKKTIVLLNEENREITESAFVREATIVFDHYIELIHKLCLEKDINLFIVFIPRGNRAGKETGGGDIDYYRIVKTTCERNRIPLIDLSPYFQPVVKGEHGEPYYFSHDPHWTAEGHHLAAKAIQKEFLNTHW